MWLENCSRWLPFRLPARLSLAYGLPGGECPRGRLSDKGCPGNEDQGRAGHHREGQQSLETVPRELAAYDSERVTRRLVGCGARPGYKFLCVPNYDEGTIFDRTRPPLAVRFTACWLLAVHKNVISAQSPQLLRGLELTSCGANELIDPCPSSFASLLEIHLVASVYDVESLLDGPCGEIGELLVRRRQFEPVEGSPRNRSKPEGLRSDT